MPLTDTISLPELIWLLGVGTALWYGVRFLVRKLRFRRWQRQEKVNGIVQSWADDMVWVAVILDSILAGFLLIGVASATIRQPTADNTATPLSWLSTIVLLSSAAALAVLMVRLDRSHTTRMREALRLLTSPASTPPPA